MMAELRKCSRCTSTIEIKYFSVNRKGEYYKCCANCRKKRNDAQQQPHRKEYEKQYYENNKEHKNAMNKQWQQNNKNILNEKVVCENCGAVTNRCNRFRHKHTNKCKEATMRNNSNEKVDETLTT